MARAYSAGGTPALAVITCGFKQVELTRYVLSCQGQEQAGDFPGNRACADQ